MSSFGGFYPDASGELTSVEILPRHLTTKETTEMMTETVNIIGAGIGGLTTALTLKQKGLNVTIFESSAEIKPVGAGIILANNAMQVFQKLGIQDKIEKAGNKISYMKITDTQLNTISVVDLTEYERKYDVHNIAIHRGELQKILANEIGYNNINLSKRLSKIEKAELFKLTFEDNSIVESKLVIGADGINSVVRNQLFEKSTLRNANQICWRGICEIDLPQKYHNELNEAWGKGKRFGFVKISDKKVYWYALANSKIVKSDEVNLTEYFSEFHSEILSLILATSKDQIIVNDIIDLKPIKKWQDKNICLIGDAAHATTPNMGQGACQAIEDAYTLGKLLDEGIALEETFAEYEKLRIKKAHKIVNTSWTVGKMAHIENDLGIWFRNKMMKIIPKSVNKKQLDMIFTLT
ncbi:FAD-dependent monooxygenase [Flavobacterium sp. ZB4P13]|uniref:FAD-dependent monooxygenase n=1 Tax=Flavobacterium sp. ZB4P13 TaxID=3401728 RepID=UPI003AAEA6D5